MDGVKKATVTTSRWTPTATFSTSVVHKWQIIAVNSIGKTTGPTWTFTVAGVPAAPSSPSPSNGSSLLAQPTLFDWADAAGATSYDVKVDGTLVGTVTASKWVPNRTFTANVRHTWQVVAKNAKGTNAGPSWTFGVYTQVPAVPKYLTPANGADPDGPPDAARLVRRLRRGQLRRLRRRQPQGERHQQQVFGADHPVKGTHTWRVVAKNPKGTTGGATWSFKF